MTVVESKVKKVAFIGFADNAIVPNVNELEVAARLVKTAKKKADIVVVSFHGGAKAKLHRTCPVRRKYSSAKNTEICRSSQTVVDAGADLVLGHGPHVLRGTEVYKTV